MSEYRIDIVVSDAQWGIGHAGLEVVGPNGEALASMHGGPVGGVGSFNRAGINSIYRDDVPLSVNMGGGLSSAGDQGQRQTELERITLVDGLSEREARQLLEAGGTAAKSVFGANTEYHFTYLPGDGRILDSRTAHPNELYQNSNSVAYVAYQEIWAVALEQKLGTNLLMKDPFGLFETPLPGLMAGVYGELQRIPECFLADTLIHLWPDELSSAYSPDSDPVEPTEEGLVFSRSVSKSIEAIEVGDVVVSYDKQGRLRPGRVSRLYRNKVRHVLDVFGLKVTPGHVTFCGDGPFEGHHVPILDILRSDGALVRGDGSKVRAVTGCDLGSEGDRMVMAIIGERQPDGQIKVVEAGEIRAGTRVILETGQDVSVLDLIEANGGVLSKDGYVQTSSDSPKLPFRWTFTPHLPKPEDYVLQRSAVTLSDIYEADEWEAVAPRVPMPRPKVTSEETTGQNRHLI